MTLTGLLVLILVLALIGFIVWVILQIPMPDLMRKLILVVLAVAIVLWLIGGLQGGGLSLPSLR